MFYCVMHVNICIITYTLQCLHTAVATKDNQLIQDIVSTNVKLRIVAWMKLTYFRNTRDLIAQTASSSQYAICPYADTFSVAASAHCR